MTVDGRHHPCPGDAMPHVLDLFRLDGRTALITGAAGGVGEVMSLTLAQLGAQVALVGRTLERVEEVAARLTSETGVRVVGLAADVADPTQAQAVVAQAGETLGPID